MARRGTFECDEIGYWSEIKLDIVREYAAALWVTPTCRDDHFIDLDGRKVASLAAISANLKELGYGE
jgi:hypothetical protein